MILDTNGLSAVADGDTALEPILRDPSELAIPVVVLGEYRYAIQQSRERQRYEQQQKLDQQRRARQSRGHLPYSIHFPLTGNV